MTDLAEEFTENDTENEMESDMEDESWKRTEYLNDMTIALYKFFEDFSKGDLLVYNPRVFNKLTYATFYEWLVKFNPELLNEDN